jgi:hypothetical protein
LKLLYRGHKYSDESFPDYVHRVSYWNGYENIKKFSRELTIFYKKVYGRDYTFSQSLYNYGKFKNIEQERHNLKWLRQRLSLERIFNFSFNTSELNLFSEDNRQNYNGGFICPDCWTENMYIRFYWRFSNYSTCRLHRKELLYVEIISYDPSLILVFCSDINASLRKAKHCYFLELIAMNKHDSCLSMSYILEEKEIAQYENKIWGNVLSCLRNYFGILHNYYAIYEFVDVGNLVGLSVVSRANIVVAAIITLDDRFEKLIKIVTILVIIKHCQRNLNKNKNNLEFSGWAQAEAYSISHLLYVYIRGVDEHLFAGGFEISSNYNGMINVNIPSIAGSIYGDDDIFKFVYHSLILSDLEADSIPVDCWKDNSEENKYYKIDYTKYIEANDINIFDKKPLVRNKSDT